MSLSVSEAMKQLEKLSRPKFDQIKASNAAYYKRNGITPKQDDDLDLDDNIPFDRYQPPQSYLGQNPINDLTRVTSEATQKQIDRDLKNG